MNAAATFSGTVYAFDVASASESLVILRSSPILVRAQPTLGLRATDWSAKLRGCDDFGWRQDCWSRSRARSKFDRINVSAIINTCKFRQVKQGSRPSHQKCFLALVMIEFADFSGVEIGFFENGMRALCLLLG